MSLSNWDFKKQGNFISVFISYRESFYSLKKLENNFKNKQNHHVTLRQSEYDINNLFICFIFILNVRLYLSINTHYNSRLDIAIALKSNCYLNTVISTSTSNLPSVTHSQHLNWCKRFAAKNLFWSLSLKCWIFFLHALLLLYLLLSSTIWEGLWNDFYIQTHSVSTKIRWRITIHHEISILTCLRKFFLFIPGESFKAFYILNYLSKHSIYRPWHLLKNQGFNPPKILKDQNKSLAEHRLCGKQWVTGR